MGLFHRGKKNNDDEPDSVQTNSFSDIMNGLQYAVGREEVPPATNINRSFTPKLGRSIRCSATYIHPHFTGNDKGLYATMIGGRIDPSSCLDTCWVDDMAVWWFRATCFHGLKYLCVNREVFKACCCRGLQTRPPIRRATNAS